MKKHPVLFFYILAFGLSWLGWAPQVAGSRGIAPFDHPAFALGLLLAALGPAIAALIVAGASEGRAGLKALLAPLLAWRVHPAWYLLALVGPVALFAGATLIDAARSGSYAGFKTLVPWYGILTALLTNLLLNVWEEIGWRGFAQQRLQARLQPLAAATLVGLLWGLWHLPLFFVRGHPFAGEPYLPWLLGIVAEAILYAWLYNGARGSLLIVTLFHAAINTVGGVAGASYLGVTVAACVAAAAVVVLVGRSLAYQRSAPPL
ncbi:MAG TPA: CPBP family intramembrane metalloprotease [Anaerolineae bacterium]|nr:CPBP family intramembrane metalloprotease [Anaerolineae bacterium]HPL26871.1 CPBP family intramembrane metalloprotease [Anaerolineae bacterium]